MGKVSRSPPPPPPPPELHLSNFRLLVVDFSVFLPCIRYIYWFRNNILKKWAGWLVIRPIRTNIPVNEPAGLWYGLSEPAYQLMSRLACDTAYRTSIPVNEPAGLWYGLSEPAYQLMSRLACDTAYITGMLVWIGRITSQPAHFFKMFFFFFF